MLNRDKGSVLQMQNVLEDGWQSRLHNNVNILNSTEMKA